MRKTVSWFVFIMACLVVQQAGCDRLVHPRTPSCGDDDVRSTLIEAALQSDAGLSASLYAAAVESLESDPQMTRKFRYRDPITGSQESTTGVQLARSLPMMLGMLDMVSGMSGFLAGLAQAADNPGIRGKFREGDRDAQRRIRAFTEDPNVQRVITAVDAAYERAKSGLRVTATRPTRIDDRLRLCDCMAQITWQDGETVLMDGVLYTAQYTTEGQLVVTYQGRGR